MFCRRFWWATVVATVFLVATATSGRATVVVASDLGSLSRDARIIARGRVVGVEARWTGDHRAIETMVTLSVDASLKGGAGAIVQFLVPGGVLGRYRSVFVGAPSLAVDDSVIVFLGGRGASLPYVLGMSQGVYRMTVAGGGWVVTPPALLPVAAPTAVVRGDASRRPMALAEFERQVRVLSGGAQ